MTIKELREHIDSYPDDYLVVLSKDGEGNNYSPLEDVDTGKYEAKTTWSGYFNDEGEHNAVFFWPVN